MLDLIRSGYKYNEADRLKYQQRDTLAIYCILPLKASYDKVGQ